MTRIRYRFRKRYLLYLALTLHAVFIVAYTSVQFYHYFERCMTEQIFQHEALNLEYNNLNNDYNSHNSHINHNEDLFPFDDDLQSLDDSDITTQSALNRALRDTIATTKSPQYHHKQVMYSLEHEKKKTRSETKKLAYLRPFLVGLCNTDKFGGLHQRSGDTSAIS